MAQGERTDPRIVERIHELADEHMTPAQIDRQLERDVDDELSSLYRLHDRLPQRRAIQNIVRAHTPRDPSGPWRMSAASNPSDAALILPVLAAVAEHSAGRTTTVTMREAEWIVRVLTAAPDVPPFDAYQLARQYMRFQDRGVDTEPLDAVLALAPWRDDAERYWRVVDASHGAVGWRDPFGVSIVVRPRRPAASDNQEAGS
jgi:hypothetical protein